MATTARTGFGRVRRSMARVAVALAVAAAAAAPAFAQTFEWSTRDTLGGGDQADPGGRYFDEHVIPQPVRPGQWVIAKVTTRGFDPIVEVQIGGQRVSVDDSQGSRLVAVAHVPVQEASETFKVIVTSWKEGASGVYDLDVQVRDDYAWYGLPAIAAVTAGAPGTPIAGYLDNTDPVVNARHVEVYSLDVAPMTFYDITVDAALDAAGRPRFDPVLSGLVANGQELFSDDAVEALADGAIVTRIERSHIRFYSPRAEKLTLVVRAYREGEGGPYTLQAQSARPRVFAVSAGFDQYVKASGLSDCSWDARRVIDALRAVGLKDGDAALLHQPDGAVQAVNISGVPVIDTKEEILAALRSFGGVMGTNDLLVFFYSGHGGRMRASAIDPSDPDGHTEYLALPEGTRLTEDELSAALPSRGRVLVILDACFSGGYARDVIDRPGRAGIFACTEDATSLVWRGVGGGYLAPLLEEALGERGRLGGGAGEFPADVDTDGVLTLAELSLYLQRRYREVIDQGATERPMATPSLDAERHIESSEFKGWQHLVIDRAGIGAFEPMLAWE